MAVGRFLCQGLGVLAFLACVAVAALPDDEMPYNRVLFAGTHNSAINLGAGTLTRPAAAVGGTYPSAAASAFQYEVMDQRLSVRDQLEQGIRLVDFEVAAIEGSFACSNGSSSPCANPPRCVHTRTLSKNCFSCCPFIVSHGSVAESAGAAPLGFTYPEDLFTDVATFARENPSEVLTLLLIATHGNSAPSAAAITARLNSTGLLPFVWNFAPSPALTRFPTLKEMRDSGRTVMLVYDTSIWPSSPGFAGSHVSSADITSPGETCAGGVPCMEGWDAVSFFQQAPSRAVLGSGGRPSNTSLFVIENLSSRRGRADDSAKYWPLPNELKDAPFQAGGNPAQGALAANYSHIVALEAAWTALLSQSDDGPSMLPSAVLVDFFNTTTPVPGIPSRTLLPNPEDGLVRAVRDINARRLALWKRERQQVLAAKAAPVPGVPGSDTEGGADEVWMVGVNEPWIAQYMQHSNVSCADCPRNGQPRSLAEIRCRLSDMVLQQGVRVFREILPFRLLQPAANDDDPANRRARQLAAEVLALYAAHNVSVILAFDRPVPHWMGPSSSWCPVPPLTNATSWGVLKDAASWAIARFFTWLVSPSGGLLSAAWATSGGLVLEPWNEFDAVADSTCAFPSDAPSAARAADLHGGVMYALRSLGFGNATQPMPTVIQPSVTGAQGSWAAFMAAYYAAGGGGYPSMHWYGCNATALEVEVAAVEAALPVRHVGQIVLGETGCSLVTEACPPGPTTAGTEADRIRFLAGLATSRRLRASCRTVLFWRTMSLSPNSSCEASFGITSADNSMYDAAGGAFFRAIGGSGMSCSCRL